MTLTTKQLLAAEAKAYRQLLVEIDDADADPNRKLASTLESKPFEDFMAGWIGVEATSVYVTRQDRPAELEFLHEAAPPIFSCSPATTPKPTFFTTRRLDAATAQQWRSVQRDSLEGPLKGLHTSAALCARHLQGTEPGSPRHLLLHFAEILGYAFLYHLLEAGWAATSSETGIDPVSVAWSALCSTHARRNGADVGAVATELIQVLNGWHARTPIEDASYSRHFMGAKRVDAIYELDKDLKKELADCVAAGKEELIRPFVVKWAAALMLSLSRLVSAGRSMKDVFWETTLINPMVEEVFLTRGLYVTIIRMTAPADQLSKGYAICTLYDSRRLEVHACRRQLDVVLRRIAHEDLALYNFRTLEARLARTRTVHDQLRRLESLTSDPAVGYEQLVTNAANACHVLSNAAGVLIASPDLGVYSSWRAQGAESRTLWCESFSGVARAALLLASDLRADDADVYGGMRELAGSPHAERLKRIFGDLQISTAEASRYSVFLLETDPRGMLLLCFSGKPNEKIETLDEIKSVADILAIGMAMSFRSAIGRGLLSLLADGMWSIVTGVRALLTGRVKHPAELWRRVTTNWSGGRSHGEDKEHERRHRRSTFDWLRDFFLATIVEVTRAGLVLIGFLFTGLVFLILWHGYVASHPTASYRSLFGEVPDPNKGIFANQALIETLGYLEALVMAFSICLAATGIVFLLKPALGTGQPGWMRRFAELGTLEKSLVRLAAMVLTIDVLTTALNPLSPRQETLSRVLLYICVLVGLAFLSAFLLADGHEPTEDDPHKDDRRDDAAARAVKTLKRWIRGAKVTEDRQ
jgi:hypothetical protein